ncbi:ABC transporter ATP-binding protein [Paenibacillus harenae]|uniref:Lipopolysaccharide transport system ATP-binding protein n=1 Tax=Paenibacillus harenae TaxID=306543 RepID=A0ABT9U6H1_PAEHA|nr:ABC transporter ATP-binding protein [Paenibacillus harenae]MDQ0060613.1 lipopolysaccharide transport system ATP-binding protein [Paenibacillus harenae]MDQ0115232.1 lipopolysaccharide transport system ATP-binding protein [Paenibacillus harenae]
MSETAIRVENISKQYKLYQKPIDRVKESLNPFKRRYHKEFHALQNISFEIKKGECVAIVGKNGSGKSTLLKIITGVLTPSGGKVSVQGKVSALLELGAGFNPDFTGLQNIYLNGTMMGYTKDEMLSKLPAIIEFADIGDFIHQPVKTYSSGMFVRLAFAVAINVDPDILIIDEALAVGDDLFQRKCYAKIAEFRKSGKTIVFVTHSSATVVELCSRAILIDNGEQLLVDKSQNVINLYQKLLFSGSENRINIREQIKAYQQSLLVPNDWNGLVSATWEHEVKTTASENLIVIQQDHFDEALVPKNPVSYEHAGARLFDYELVNSDGKKVNIIQFGEKYTWRYKAEFFKNCLNIRFGMMIKTSKGLDLCGAATHLYGKGLSNIKKGEVFQVEYSFVPRFVAGVYFMNCGILGLKEQGEEVFFHRFVEAWAFKIQDQTDSLLSGMVDMDLKSTVNRLS